MVRAAGFVGRMGPATYKDGGIYFSAGDFPSYLTFTRASSGTYISSTGYVATASTDVPRFGYDPSTLAARGLLIEGNRTNLIDYSTEYSNAAWTKTNSSVTADAAVAPDGTTTATKFYENSATAAHLIEDYYNVTSGTTYCQSVFAKAGERTLIQLRFTSTGTTWGTSNEPRADFNLVNGTVTAVVGGSAGTCFSQIIPYGNGWYRCILVATAAASTTSANRYYTMTTSGGTTSYAGDGSSGVYIWGSQFEAASFASSYIPTTSSSATRAADICTVSNLSSIGFNSTEGTIIVEFELEGLSASGTQYIAQFDDGTSSNRIFLGVGSTNVRIEAYVGGATQCSSSVASVASGSVYKAVFAYKENNFAGCVNGGSIVADGTGTVPTGLTTLRLGVATGGVSQLNGWIRRITYYPTRLPNAQLQALTA